jgi:hypothetical protein
VKRRKKTMAGERDVVGQALYLAVNVSYRPFCDVDHRLFLRCRIE